MSVNVLHSLAHLLRTGVPTAIAGRGERYVRQNRVEILGGNSRQVVAVVSGSDEYEVVLGYDESFGVLLYECTCPYEEERGGPCKHVWATVLTAESRGLLEEAACDRRSTLFSLMDFENGEEPPVLPDTGAKMRRTSPAQPSWREQLASIAAARHPVDATSTASYLGGEGWAASRELLYVIDAARTKAGAAGLVVETNARDRKANGEWGKPVPRVVDAGVAARLPDPTDRELMALLNGAREGVSSYSYGYYGSGQNGGSQTRLTLPIDAQAALLPRMCGTGRTLLRGKDEAELQPVAWDDGPAWALHLRVQATPDGASYELVGVLRRGEEERPLKAPRLITAGRIVFFDAEEGGVVATRFDDGGAFPWVPLLRNHGNIEVPLSDGMALIEHVVTMPAVPPLDVPEPLRFERRVGECQPVLTVRQPGKKNTFETSYGRLVADLTFEYGNLSVHSDDPRDGLFDGESRTLIERDRHAEAHATAALYRLNFHDASPYATSRRGHHYHEVASRHLPAAVRELTARGWRVEAEGKLYRTAGDFTIRVSSGVDWFELHGDASFDDQTAPLPTLLRALQKGQNSVVLDDGSIGILPQEWLDKYARLAGLGEEQDDHVRFKPTQTALLDALLAAMPQVDVDAQFTKARDRLRDFNGITPADPPDSFRGTLRDYQREGLGWLHFLRGFGFGGCLADDMGLGKTVQVLALLEDRRRAKRGVEGPRGRGVEEEGNDGVNEIESADDGASASSSGPLNPSAPRPLPSLAVVPRSLLHNWEQEAARFTPDLRVLVHSGNEREKDPAAFADHDLVLTTYGTLRRDAAFLKDARFDYAILDEAQAIKNASTATAKAARLLDADHRLAMTGTPVENHLGELWSIFEFLNPGMLGRDDAFKKLASSTGDSDADAEAHRVLSRALGPYILRRTKKQVAPELPEKSEQTLYCDLVGKQKKHYEQLRDHYRKSLLGKVDQQGLNKSKIQVLEALLRLRQAACHPGLIDEKRIKEPSAKLDMLAEQLTEVLDEGHKALVFSQFTSLLSIVRQRLDKDGTIYEYLDGKTRDRAARCERFQSDPDVKLFLISLKAGGVGLNLTAADYVFLLDPWWNPAVEQQAIDRTHRIGQTRQVFAYRIIARDTVEEKVLELQESKRNLADAILKADSSLIRDITREDLELLLS